MRMRIYVACKSPWSYLVALTFQCQACTKLITIAGLAHELVIIPVRFLARRAAIEHRIAATALSAGPSVADHASLGLPECIPLAEYGESVGDAVDHLKIPHWACATKLVAHPELARKLAFTGVL